MSKTEELPEGEKVESTLARVNTSKIQLSGTVTPIAEVLEELFPRGEDAKLVEFEGQMITVIAVDPFVGKYGPAAWVLFVDNNGVLYNTVVGQKIVLPKLLAVKERLPVSATFVQVEGGQYGKYWDIL